MPWILLFAALADEPAPETWPRESLLESEEPPAPDPLEWQDMEPLEPPSSTALEWQDMEPQGEPANEEHGDGKLALRPDWVSSFDREEAAAALPSLTEKLQACVDKHGSKAPWGPIRLRLKTDGEGYARFVGIEGAAHRKLERCINAAAAGWLAPGRGTITATWED